MAQAKDTTNQPSLTDTAKSIFDDYFGRHPHELEDFKNATSIAALDVEFHDANAYFTSPEMFNWEGDRENFFNSLSEYHRMLNNAQKSTLNPLYAEEILNINKTFDQEEHTVEAFKVCHEEAEKLFEKVAKVCYPSSNQLVARKNSAVVSDKQALVAIPGSREKIAMDRIHSILNAEPGYAVINATTNTNTTTTTTTATTTTTTTDGYTAYSTPDPNVALSQLHLQSEKTTSNQEQSSGLSSYLPTKRP